MNRLLLAGAAFLALTGFAAAQTPPDGPPPLPSQTEAPAVEVTPPASPADAPDARPGSRPENRGAARMRGGPDHQMKQHRRAHMGHGDMGRHGPRHGSAHGKGHWQGGYHHGDGASDDAGARFTFEGPGRGKVDIRCAAGESTQDCVDAVLPMLRSLMQEFHGARNRP
jgi:hypothetical protein